MQQNTILAENKRENAFFKIFKTIKGFQETVGARSYYEEKRRLSPRKNINIYPNLYIFK